MSWPVVKLGEVAKPLIRQRERDDLPVLSITKNNGFVRSDEYFKKVVHSKDLSKYKVVHAGDFAFSPIHLDEGSIALAYEAGQISPMYKVFSIDEGQCDPSYIARLLKTEPMIALYGTLGSGFITNR